MILTAAQAKLISMLAIGIGSFVVGIAPACFVSRARELQQKLLLSCTLCLGGGVLLGTSLLHMLPEVREGLPDHAELIFTCGFLLLYLVDEVVHYFWNSDVDHAPEMHYHGERSERGRGDRCRSHSHQVSSATATQNVRGVCVRDGSLKSPYRSSPTGNCGANNWKTTSYGTAQCISSTDASAPFYSHETTFLCHGNHNEVCPDSTTGVAGLFFALTVHAILEGLAIGLQKETAEVLLLVGAVASHKFVVSFCLGLELAGSGSTVLKLLFVIFVFSSGSAIGIGIGMLAIPLQEGWTKVALPVLQGLAGGTLLYVTVSEVLPRERTKWHGGSRRSAGILQFFSTAIGFVLIFLLNRYVHA